MSIQLQRIFEDCSVDLQVNHRIRESNRAKKVITLEKLGLNTVLSGKNLSKSYVVEHCFLSKKLPCFSLAILCEVLL